jgi:hypothetical protein
MEVSCQPYEAAALPSGKSPGTHGIGGWVEFRAGLGAVAKRKFHDCFYWTLKPVHLVRNLVPILTELPRPYIEAYDF